mgnify:CR=1 FL=1
MNHLRLVMGTSMGGMHTWLWGELHPEFMDALMPLASLPMQISGRNRVYSLLDPLSGLVAALNDFRPAIVGSYPTALALKQAGNRVIAILGGRTRALVVLEEELLFPASTQMAVFLSMDVGKFFQLDAVELKIDDKVVTHYLYTDRENAALQRGGVQRLYLGNLRTGKHELVAFFTGKGTHDRDYRRGTTLTFEKTTESKFVELQIRHVERKLQPEFQVKVWK